MLTDWFAQKNVDYTVIFVTIFITGTNKVRLITDKIVFYTISLVPWNLWI